MPNKIDNLKELRYQRKTYNFGLYIGYYYARFCVEGQPKYLELAKKYERRLYRYAKWMKGQRAMEDEKYSIERAKIQIRLAAIDLSKKVEA